MASVRRGAEQQQQRHQGLPRRASDLVQSARGRSGWLADRGRSGGGGALCLCPAGTEAAAVYCRGRGGLNPRLCVEGQS